MLVDSSADEELNDAAGLCKSVENILYVNTDYTPPEAYPRVRAHEEFHGIGYGNGARAATKMYLKALGLNLSDEQMLEFEEFLNETYGQGWFAYLSDNGYLKYPQL